jgi:hypothetical protein
MNMRIMNEFNKFTLWIVITIFASGGLAFQAKPNIVLFYIDDCPANAKR